MAISLQQGNSTTVGNGGPLGTALDPELRPRSDAAAGYQQLADGNRGTGAESLADFLGFFSMGLGLAQLARPGMLSRVVGIDPHDDRNRSLMRMMGLREITHGLAILSNQQPAKSVWSRVGGDALDLALLGKALTNRNNRRALTAFAAANVLTVTALDILAARRLSSQPPRQQERGIVRTRRSVTVRRPVDEVYAFWRNFENLPRFMRHLESVTSIDERRSRWVAKAPAGRTAEWEAEMVEDRPGELIAWRSTRGADVYNAGTVRFQPAPGGRGTEVRVELEYDPPLGKLGSKVAMLFREEPGQQVQDDLRHFKQVMETGDIVLSDATRRRGMHPAQPDPRPTRL